MVVKEQQNGKTSLYKFGYFPFISEDVTKKKFFFKWKSANNGNQDDE